MSDSIRALASSMVSRKISGTDPYILFLGAGTSISSGCSSMMQIVDSILEQHAKSEFDKWESEIKKATKENEKYGDLLRNEIGKEKRTRFFEIWGTLDHETKYSILRPHLWEDKNPSEGYKNLAKLIKKGYIKTVLSTNLDNLLEKALNNLGYQQGDFIVVVNGKDQPKQIVERLNSSHTSLKIIKLHGSLESPDSYAFKPNEIFEFENKIKSDLSRLINQSLIIVGYSGRDRDVDMLFEGEGREIHFVNPTILDTESRIYQILSVRNKGKIIDGSDGNFDLFFKKLLEYIECDEGVNDISSSKREENNYGIKLISKKELEVTTRHFITLHAFLSSSKLRYWPKLRDVKDGSLYWPEICFEKIEKIFREKGLCMLTGISGSGKTVLAIAFGLWWLNSIKRNHQNAAVFYLDADTKTRGEDWYREVLTYDYQNKIFIVDNCHLNTEEVNFFCNQLESKRPENAFFLLISAPRISESPWGDEPEDYFDYFEQAEAMLTLHSEYLYKNILQTYSDIYARTDPQRFIPVEKDFIDSDRATKLELLCSHNLVVVKSVLEAWGKVGGWLSDVTVEIVLDSLADRYLSRVKKPALVHLCNLGQFEIPAHENFINQDYMRDSIEALLKENLIFPEDDELFGHCYKVSFHPKVAALIFQAYIYKKVGSTFEKRIEDEIFNSLKSYLSLSPENFILVYSRTYLSNIDLQRRLLSDTELQKYAFQQFTARPLNEVSQYLYALYKINPDKAKNLLQNFIDQKTIEILRAEVLGLTRTQFSYISIYLPKIDLEISQKILGKLPINFFVNYLQTSNLRTIEYWISSRSTSLAAKLGYSIAWRQQISKRLDLDILMESMLKARPQQFVWFLRDFITIDKERSKLLIYKLPPEEIGKKFNGQPLSIINYLFLSISKIDPDPIFMRRITNIFDQTTLFNKIQDSSLQNIFWALRRFNDVSPELSRSILSHITPAGLAERIRTDQGTVQNIMDFIRVSDIKFRQEFLQHVNDEEIFTIFERSKLGEIGTLLENYFYIFELSYSIFAIQKLPNMLAKQELCEVSKFIKRIQSVPKKGQHLAAQILDLFLKTDLTDRVINSDVEQLALLLDNSSFSASYPNKILSAVTTNGAVEKSLPHSGIRGIQLLIRNLSSVAPKFLPIISQSLQTLDLSDQIKEAEIKDLGHFLWNIQANLGAELAQKYCRIIDANIQSKQIANSTRFELGGFLWNLVHISDMKEFRILSMPVLSERLKENWEEDPSQCISIFGIMATVNPEAVKKINFLSIDIKSISDKLVIYLTKNINLKPPHPYLFALTIKGLQILDEKRTTEIIQNIFCNEDIIDRYQKIFSDTMSKDNITLRSLNLLKSVDTFVCDQITV
jgi:hypothetical protein